MEIPEPVSGIPASITHRCTGKQAPIAPHAQRMLVASTKAAKTQGVTEKGKPSKPKPKAKGKAKGKPKKDKEASDPRKTPSAYAQTKAAYMLKFLSL